MTKGRRMSSRVVKLRAEERRALRMEEIRAQVEAGELTVRLATAEERARYGIRVDDADVDGER